MSNFKTHVLLFPLIALFATSIAFGNGFTNNTCRTFYFKNFKKPLFQPSEPIPVGGIWDKPKPYSPSATNRFFNNSNTRNLDQQYSKECFIFSLLGALESTHVNRHINPRKIEFSGAYLIAKKFENIIGEIISNNQNGQGMYFKLDGGETYHAMKLIQLYGLVPEEIWKPRIPMDQWDFKKIYNDIANEVNIIINNRNANPNAYSVNDYPALVKAIFTKVMGDYVGEWPKPFWYDGIHYTPETFGQMYGFDRNGEVEIRYTNLNGPYQDPAQTFNLPFFINPMLSNWGFNRNHSPENTRTVFEAVKQALASNRAVLIDVDGVDPIVGHQFAITDLEILPNGMIKAVKIKNSYTKWGDGGYAWYRPEAITPLLRRIWILDVNSNIPAAKMNPHERQ